MLVNQEQSAGERVAWADANRIIDLSWDWWGVTSLPSAEQLLQKYQPRSVSPIDVLPIVEERLQGIQSTKALLETYLSENDLPSSIDAFDSITEFEECSGHDMYLLFNDLRDHMSSMPALSRMNRESSLADTHAKMRDRDERQYQDACKTWRDKKEARELIDQEIILLTNMYQEVAVLPHLKRGLVAFMSAVLFGVVCPIVLLAAYPESPKLWITIVCLSGLALSLASIGAYLWTIWSDLGSRK